MTRLVEQVDWERYNDNRTALCKVLEIEVANCFEGFLDYPKTPEPSLSRGSRACQMESLSLGIQPMGGQVENPPPGWLKRLLRAGI